LFVSARVRESVGDHRRAMFWGMLWGAIGLVLAIPITASLKRCAINQQLAAYGRRWATDVAKRFGSSASRAQAVGVLPFILRWTTTGASPPGEEKILVRVLPVNSGQGLHSSGRFQATNPQMSLRRGAVRLAHPAPAKPSRERRLPSPTSRIFSNTRKSSGQSITTSSVFRIVSRRIKLSTA
jgi:hypothetical protein